MTSNSPDQAEEAAAQVNKSTDVDSHSTDSSAAAATPANPEAEPAPEATETEVTNSEDPGASTDAATAPGADTAAPEGDGPAAETRTAAGPADSLQHEGEHEAPPATAASEPPPVVDHASLEKLQAEAGQLSHKHSAKLNNLHKRLQKLHNAISEEQIELRQLADAVNATVTDLLARNHEHQQQLHDKTVALMATLEKALADGKSDEALPTWDKIQGNLTNTSGKVRAALQELTAPFKGQLNELRDWKIFAATEKKRELITQMQQLVNAEMSPQDLNRKIGKLHKQWKALGRSNDNDKLWAEFKTISDQAYEPCKEFFKQRKQLMTENLKQRRALCDQLEAELGKIDPDAVDVAAINKLLANTDKAWKKYAPVEQSKIKPMQKRYYGLLNQLRKLRKSHARDNAAQKQALIAEAVKLTQLDDKRQAMQEAKRLQREWKDIGPSSFKEDKTYWAEFRTACDQIFAQRDQVSAARKEKQQQAESELRGLLDKLDQHLALDDGAFRDAKSEFHELARQFNAALNAEGRGTRNKLVDRFNEVKRRIDGRYRALPDKKTQALKDDLEALLSQLEPLEQILLAQASDDNSANIDTAAPDDFPWQVLGSLGEKDLVTRLEARRKLLTSPEAMVAQAQQAEAELRTLCVEAEIRAGVDSPEEDQGMRMQIQLKQLQDGFGQSRPTAKENLVYARHLELLQRCIGPLNAKTREQLQSRLQQVLRRLI